MKKLLKKIFPCIMILSIYSCKDYGYKLIETNLTNDYKIKLPEYLVKNEDGVWKYKNDTFDTVLYVNVVAGTSSSVNLNFDEEIEIKSKYYDQSELYKGKYFVKSEIISINGFNGKISFYEQKNTGKGLGLVSLQAYIVIGVIEDSQNRIYLFSNSFNKNINDDLLKSIKSISSNVNKTNIIKFDELKAKKDGYQIFADENFIIKCKAKILFDKLRYEDGMQNGQNDSKPYHVFNDGVDYNINVGDMSEPFYGKNENEIKTLQNENLIYYQTKFDEMEIKNEQKRFKEFNAVYYEITQDGKLTKAIYFQNGFKNYMLQVTSKSETKKIFDEFVNSFDLINK